MTVATPPLKDLVQRIAQQEAELAALRRDYKVRQEQLTTLTRRKEELEAQLRQVEKDITTIAQGRAARPKTPVPKATGAKPIPRATQDQSAPPASLTAFIVALVREANGRPISLSQVTEEATRRGLTATSRNPDELVRWHAKELVKKHILRRAPKRAGLLLDKQKKAPAAADLKPAPTDGKPAARAASKAPPSSPRGSTQEQPPLRAVILDLLQKSKRPLVAREIAEQALANGYRTDSKDFINLVQVTLARMNEVKRAPEGGYRLKKVNK